MSLMYVMLLLALEISYITVQGLCELALLFSSKFKKNERSNKKKADWTAMNG